MRNYDPTQFKRTVTKPGSGEGVKSGDTLKVDYKGFIHGVGLFESSDKSGAPKTVKLGEGKEVKCLDEGI